MEKDESKRSSFISIEQTNDEWLIDWVKTEMKELVKLIKIRANGSEVEEEDLFSISMNFLPSGWDNDDWENHNWDLSRWYCLKEIIEQLENYNENNRT